MMEIPLEKEAVFMDPTQTLELAQALKLSPTLLQSMNILQMTTLELSAYLKDLALENPVLEEQEGGTSWEEFAHQVSWLADQPGPSGGEAVGEPGRIDQETSSLSFLGLGTLPPQADWGAMLDEGRSVLLMSPVQSLSAGIVIVIVVVSLNIFSDGLHQYLDQAQTALPSFRKYEKKFLKKKGGAADGKPA